MLESLIKSESGVMNSTATKARNDPFLKHHHPNYTPIKKVPNEEIKNAANRFLDAKSAETFLKRTSVPPTLKAKAGKLFNN